MRDIGAASPGRWHSTQLLKRIGATSLLNVTADFDFVRPSALLDGATKKAEARVVSAVRAAKRVRFMVVTSFDSHCFSYGGCSRQCNGHASCQWLRLRTPRTGFYTNYLPTD